MAKVFQFSISISLCVCADSTLERKMYRISRSVHKLKKKKLKIANCLFSIKKLNICFRVWCSHWNLANFSFIENLIFIMWNALRIKAKKLKKKTHTKIHQNMPKEKHIISLNCHNSEHLFLQNIIKLAATFIFPFHFWISISLVCCSFSVFPWKENGKLK